MSDAYSVPSLDEKSLPAPAARPVSMWRSAQNTRHEREGLDRSVTVDEGAEYLAAIADRAMRSLQCIALFDASHAMRRASIARAGLVQIDPKSIKKPAFYAGFVEVLGSFRMSSDDPNGPGTNQKSPELLDSNMVSEIQAEQLPPELPR